MVVRDRRVTEARVRTGGRDLGVPWVSRGQQGRRASRGSQACRARRDSKGTKESTEEWALLV